MTTILLYIVRGGFYLGLFYAFFLLVMRRTKLFRLNRTLLLVGSYLCLLLPAIRIRTVDVNVAVTGITMIAAGAEPIGQTLPPVSLYWKFLMGIYCSGAIVTFILYLANAWKMGKLIRRGQSIEQDGCQLILLEESIPSFSWGRMVVMCRKDFQDNSAIYTHELVHVQSRHSLDLLLFIPIHCLSWWNPLTWITRKELQLLHEYEADEGVLELGIDATSYQLLLVQKAAGERCFSLANEFQHAELKNRIEMMLKSGTSKWLSWSYLTLIPLMAGAVFFCNPAKAIATAPKQAYDTTYEQAPLQKQEADTNPTFVRYRHFVRLPSFNGGEIEEFTRWVNARITNNDLVVQGDTQGNALVQFTVDTDGTVRDVTLVSSLREDLDIAAIQAVSSSPKWEPAINTEGIPVPVSFAISVSFQKK